MWIPYLWMRVVLTLGAVLGAFALTLPTLESFATGKSSEQLSLQYINPVNLGLDLKGGMYLEMQAKVDQAIDFEVEHHRKNLIEFLGGQGYDKSTLKSERVEGSNRRLLLILPVASFDAAAELIVEQYAPLREVERDPTAGRLTLEFPEEQAQVLRDQAFNQAIDTIRNRIDEFGVAEPSIRKQGRDRIIIQLPGELNPDRIKNVVNRTAFLEFRIVDESAPVAALRAPLIAKADEVRTALGAEFDQKIFLEQVNEAFKDQIPEGTSAFFGRQDITDPATGRITDVRWTPYLIKSETLLTGRVLTDARVQFDNQMFGYPYVSMTFDSEGADTFGRVTTENVNRQLAIILDGVVHSAPNINEPITGGRAQISGQFTPEQAADLALVLRSGSLPVEVKSLRQSVVGPGLGRDSIESGMKATLLGTLLVVLFMIFYYKGLGVVAVLALGSNLILILACMVGLEATMTLPGIAGLALTMGMAVDANVLIYERIREEINSGKSTRQAIALGFERAFVTILDANITTLIAGVVLFQYGTGPIKGFAATLSLGILTTVFSAVFVTRTLIQIWMDLFKLPFEIRGEDIGAIQPVTARTQP